MIKVYTTKSCVFCHALLDWLDEKGVKYVEVDATNNPDIQAVPLTVIGEEEIMGFDRPAIKKALKKLAA